ncbi:MAG TPA: hypothetical protein VFB45_04590 [Pseudolabrys sp.]|nr:hypothetical protein [Pseudolabrys sp.]
MTIMVSVGIRAYRPEQMRQVLAQMHSRSRDPAVYTGHEYTECFHVGDEIVIMNKLRNNNVELVLCGDDPDELFAL